MTSPKEETLEETLAKKARAGLEERFEQIRAYTPDWNAEKEKEYYDRLAV